METDSVSDRPPAIWEQRVKIQELFDIPPQVGETWYILDAKWWKSLQRHLKWSSLPNDESPPTEDPPGWIDNRHLIDKQGRLVPHKFENLDFVVVHESLWSYLVNLYGGEAAGPVLPRRVISTGLHSHAQVEVYPLYLKCSLSTAIKDVKEISFSRTETIKDVKEKIFQVFEVADSSKARLWYFYFDSPNRVLDDETKKLSDAFIDTGDKIVVDVQKDNGDWSVSRSDRAQSFGTSSYSSGSYVSQYRSSGHGYGTSTMSSYSDGKASSQAKPGVCGFQNLGNTCFMNSALQCLSNTQPLTEFLLSGEYEKDINVENPLGMKGKLVSAYANLMKQVWKGEYSYFSPREFKHVIGQFAPQFMGYAQHDSQELLSFLLDGLHEDLNRVLDKPPTNPVEHNDRPDEEVAAESWKVHLLRNQSIIVDAFQGQLKSTLICPTPSCAAENHKSITFDPYMFLSLSLPVEKNRCVSITCYTFGRRQEPTTYGIVLNKFASIALLRRKCGEILSCPADDILVCEVFNSRIYRVYNDEDVVDTLASGEKLVAYEVPGLPASIHKEKRYGSVYDSKVSPFLVITNRKMERDMLYNSDSARLYSSYQRRMYRATMFGVPFLLPFTPGETTGEQLYLSVWANLRHCVRNDEIFSSSAEALFPTYQPPADDASKEPSKPLFTLSFVDASGNDLEKSYILFSSEPVAPPSRASYYQSRYTIAVSWNEEILSSSWDENACKFAHIDSSVDGFKEDNRDSVSLVDCLRMFITPETLLPEDSWYCNKCGQFVEAEKKMDLWSTPEILVIHLKRFSYTRYFRDKLDMHVSFPIEGLDLSEFVFQPNVPVPPVYDLFAVSYHYGGLGGGHYTATAKNFNDNKWYNFDDSHVSPSSPDRIDGRAAYLLFYRRRFANQISAGVSSISSNSDDNSMEVDMN